MLSALDPLRSGFSENQRAITRVFRRNFYARGTVAYRTEGATRDRAMKTYPKNRSCEVYSVSGNGHGFPGSTPAQVRKAVISSKVNTSKPKVAYNDVF